MKQLLIALTFTATLAFADLEQAQPQRFAELIETENTVLIDVRSPAEIANGKIRNALEIDFFSEDFASQLAELPKDKTLLFYCRSGNRSGQSVDLLAAQGYQNLVNLAGGIIAWQAQALPLSNDPLSISVDRKSGVYQTGETIAATARYPSDLPSNSLKLKVLKNHTEILAEEEIALTESPSEVFQTNLTKPGSVIFEATVGEATDTIGAIVAPEHIKPGYTRPSDFDNYWRSIKDKLAAMPIESKLEPIELGEAEQGTIAFDVEINSPGPRPARGIFAKPAAAKAGSLPIVIKFRAAGVAGEWCRSKLDETLALAKRGNGALSFDLNAHGMLNHEPESYYQDLENGPLKDYWDIGIENREDNYFGFMYQRMLRTIEFLTRQPEWDGKRILVIGESQGGGQALVAAGQDPRVTAAVVIVPALCDFGAPLVGRKGGWPQPIDWRTDNQKAIFTMAYFDAALHLKNSKAEIFAEIGLIDQTCPSTSIYAALNQSEGVTTIYPVSYRDHPWPEGADRTIWDRTVEADRNQFIDDYLK